MAQKALAFSSHLSSPSNPGFIAEEIEFLRSVTDRQVKATLPSPALLGERLWSAEHSSRAYPHRDDFVRACTPILRHELLLVRDAGADIVQIDDPYLCLFVDPEVRAQHEGPAAASAFAVDTANELVEGIDEVKLAVHLCRRAGARVRGDQRHAG